MGFKRALLVLGGISLACAPLVSTKPRPVSAPVTRADESVSDPEEDRDDVEVEGLLGTLEMSVVQPIILASWREIESCYTQASEANAFIAGKLVLTFRVSRAGTVKDIWEAESDLGAWSAEKCILDVARGMKFPEPDGGEAEFSVPISFPENKRVLVRDEHWTKPEMAPKLAELEACRGLVAGVLPDVVITIYVGDGGVVQSVGFGGLATGSQYEPWIECADAKARAWKLADPRGVIWKIQSTYGVPLGTAEH